jgi:hypothetical protein
MVLKGVGGWENPKTLATNAEMRGERRRQGKEGREAMGKKTIAGTRHHKTTSPPKKTPNRLHIRKRPTQARKSVKLFHWRGTGSVLRGKEYR